MKTKEDWEKKAKHLDFVQSNIDRMFRASFYYRSWMVITVSALLAVYARVGSIELIWISILPLTLFWSLDAYYLDTESRFRSLFNAVNRGEVEAFSMSPIPRNATPSSLFRAAFSGTLLFFYGATLLVVVSILTFFYCSCSG